VLFGVRPAMLLLKVSELPQPYPMGGRQERVTEVLLDELLNAPIGGLHADF
jgi:hypothetical protein